MRLGDSLKGTRNPRCQLSCVGRAISKVRESRCATDGHRMRVLPGPAQRTDSGTGALGRYDGGANFSFWKGRGPCRLSALSLMEFRRWWSLYLVPSLWVETHPEASHWLYHGENRGYPRIPRAPVVGRVHSGVEQEVSPLLVPEMADAFFTPPPCNVVLPQPSRTPATFTCSPQCRDSESPLTKSLKRSCLPLQCENLSGIPF